MDTEAMSEEVREFERIYGVPTSRMREPFTHDGHIEEHPDLQRWSMLAGLLQRLDVNFAAAV